jgi:hypothetical protein
MRQYNPIYDRSIPDRSIQGLWRRPIILETAVQGDKVMQSFELESLLMGAEHSQKVKAAPIESDYSSKDCITLSP